MLQRKIIAASITGALFAVLLGFTMPNPFGEQVVEQQNYLFAATEIISLYLMYGFPVILLYGVLTSIVSDRLANYVSKKSGYQSTELIVSGLLHIVFGLVLLPYSLGASILFFVTDKLLEKRQESFPSLHALKSFLLPLTIWIISLGIVWVEHFINS